MSLYRKYRPKIFADVYGQEHVVQTLENAVERDKLVHAYLFAGSRGTGKTSVARILAKVLMTRGIEDETLKKQIAKAVDEGNTVDLLEIDAASNRGIDDVRELIEKMQFSPVVAKSKVYIIDEVHMLTKEAFNALLKTLEEPPEYAYFILATTEFNKIPETIKSRCQCFPFRRIRESDIVRRLQFIADQERIAVEREALRLIAHVSDGGMRDAISLLDQLRSLENITVSGVKQHIGGAGQDYVDAVIAALGANDREALLASVTEMEEAGVPLDVFTRNLLELTRESLHAAIEKKEPIDGFIRMMEILLQAIRDMRASPIPGLVLEAALFTLCEGKTTQESVPTILKQAEASVSAPPEAEKKIEKKSAPAALNETPKETIVEAPDLSMENVRGAWKDVVNEASPPSVKMSLKNGRVVALKDTTVTVGFSSAFHRDKVRSTEASRSIEDILQRIFKKQLKLECTLENGEEDDGSNSEMVNLAEAAAEIF